MTTRFSLMRLGPRRAEVPAARAENGAVYSLADLTHDIDGPFLAGGGIDAVAAALAAKQLPFLADWEEARVGAPIASPSAIICIGMNYAAHAAESGAESPAAPIMFLKHPNTLAGPNDDVLIPHGSTALDWEVELALVIGARARYLHSPDEAADCIAGVCVTNDISERDFQLNRSGGQWSKGKCAENFNPMGPYLVPAQQVDLNSLRLRTWVNGEIRQDSTTADMIFDPWFLVWHLSQYLTLEPGDVINTGTPQGVGLSGRFPYLQIGDVVTTEIEHLGSQQQRVAPTPIAPVAHDRDSNGRARYVGR